MYDTYIRMTELSDIYQKTKLIDLYRMKRGSKEIIKRYFPTNNDCFSCYTLSDVTLEEACKIKNINMEDVISELLQLN